MCEHRQKLCTLSVVILLVLSVRGRVIPDDGHPLASIEVDTCYELNKTRSEIRCPKIENASGYTLTIDAIEFEPKEIIEGEYAWDYL